MAMKKKTCPACGKKIIESAKQCPECKKTLEIVHWEVEREAGENVVFAGPDAEKTIRDQLISGEIHLLNRCRKFTTVLESVQDEKDLYGTKEEKEWKTLRDYGNKSFTIQALYNPVQAYGKRAAIITSITIGVITAVGWNADILLAAGANPFAAVLLGIVLLALTPTVIGLAAGSFVVGSIYDLPPFGMAFRTFFSIVIGAIVGAAVGWTIGYAVGMLVGLTKKKALAV